MRKKIISDSGLTARQLLANTPNYIIYNGEYVSLKKLNRKADRAGEVFYLGETLTQVLGSKPRRHKQRIGIVDGTKKASETKTRIKVECDCDFHKYTCEVALHRYGAADIIHSNGDFPFMTNPKGIPLVCKHLYVMLRKIVGTRS